MAPTKQPLDYEEKEPETRKPLLSRENLTTGALLALIVGAVGAWTDSIVDHETIGHNTSGIAENKGEIKEIKTALGTKMTERDGEKLERKVDKIDTKVDRLRGNYGKAK